MDVLGQRTTDEDYSEVLSSLKKPHLEYFKMFYGDTAMFGANLGINCGLEFFGIDHVEQLDMAASLAKEDIEWKSWLMNARPIDKSVCGGRWR